MHASPLLLFPPPPISCTERRGHSSEPPQSCMPAINSPTWASLSPPHLHFTPAPPPRTSLPTVIQYSNEMLSASAPQNVVRIATCKGRVRDSFTGISQAEAYITGTSCNSQRHRVAPWIRARKHALIIPTPIPISIRHGECSHLPRTSTHLSSTGNTGEVLPSSWSGQVYAVV